MFKSALIGFFIVASIIILIDIYAWQGVKLLTAQWSSRSKSILKWGYWGWTAAGFFFFMFLRMGLFEVSQTTLRIISSLMFAVFFAKLFWCVFLLIDDITRLFRWIYSRYGAKAEGVAVEGGITRYKFLSWMGLGLGSAFIGGSIWGIAKGAHNYVVRRKTLAIKGLPAAFNGVKIVQLSDIHSGSFWSYDAVKRGVDMVLAEKPDVFFFTGDLVNDKAEEIEPWLELFGQIEAPLGKFSILGNHDYGDYVPWPDFDPLQAKLDQKEKGFYRTPMQQRNLDKLFRHHKVMGWDLLLNENRVIEKEGEKLSIVGVENWSNKGRFPKYGKLDEALKGSEGLTKLLLSHDPSHWREQVLGHQPEIAVTFSGHTHGMQFGVDTRFYRWSPVKLLYKEWLDLYSEGDQHLYVNRGFGYLGYPGRIGVFPEISVFTLQSA